MRRSGRAELEKLNDALEKDVPGVNKVLAGKKIAPIVADDGAKKKSSE